ncbi:MAG: S41 family peptidase [Ruminococcus sp.]|nr:S41 family peptidase [Ruminococcus sp.]
MENERKIKLLTCLLVIVTVLSAAFGFLLFREKRLLEKKLDENAQIMELEKYIDDNYYKAPDKEAVMNGALKGYVAGLEDPYSSYLTADEYDDWQNVESGTMVGIGVTVQADEAGLYVVSVTEGSPAYTSGIQEGDIITEVEGESVSEIGYEEAVVRIKGEKNTQTVLTIRRNEELLEMSVMRSEIEVITVSGTMLEDNTGYIRISAFRENTDEQFIKIFDKLIADGAEGIIFDLRNNGGGLLNSLEKILDPLLPEGIIATATYGNGDVKTIVESDNVETDLPMAVLVNGNTASAAELFAASLSDFNKAFLVGETTYGKGVMQYTAPVAGGGLTLTVATYQTVRGECYHKIGITPDYQVSLAENFNPDFEAPDIENDAQLKIAFENLK